jgi:hypothetical protein
MANKIQAVNTYRPKVKLGKRATPHDLVAFISRSTGLNEGTISQVLIELRDATLFYNRQGQPVYLEGLGTYSPKIELDGKMGISHRADMKLKNGLNTPGTFSGEIINRVNIGKSGDDLVELWNTDHPDDLVS